MMMDICVSKERRAFMWTENVEQTEKAGQKLAEWLVKRGTFPAFVVLDGDLGTGKTVFARGMVRAIAPRSRVHSPTFTLVNEYRTGTLPVFHFDLYRIEEEEDLYAIGFDDYARQKALLILEWGSRAPGVIPPDAIIVRIEKEPDRPDRRKITILQGGEPLHVDFGS